MGGIVDTSDLITREVAPEYDTRVAASSPAGHPHPDSMALRTQKGPTSQLRALESALRRGEPVAFSAMTLLEIAVLSSTGKLVLTRS